MLDRAALSASILQGQVATDYLVTLLDGKAATKTKEQAARQLELFLGNESNYASMRLTCQRLVIHKDFDFENAPRENRVGELVKILVERTELPNRNNPEGEVA